MKNRKIKKQTGRDAEQSMLRIEHNGFWIGYVGLAVVILMQMICYGPGRWDLYGGEFIIFMGLSVYILAGCVKHGVWDRKFAPTWKVNLGASLIAGVLGGIVNFSDHLYAVSYMAGMCCGWPCHGNGYICVHSARDVACACSLQTAEKKT